MEKLINSDDNFAVLMDKPSHSAIFDFILSWSMFSITSNSNFELSYYKEDRMITYYLLNNKIDEDKKIDILKYLKSLNYDFNSTDNDKNSILHYLSNYQSDNNKLYELVLSYCNDIMRTPRWIG